MIYFVSLHLHYPFADEILPDGGFFPIPIFPGSGFGSNPEFTLIFFPAVLAGWKDKKRIYFFFEDFSSWWINLHLFTHSQFSGRYFPSDPGFMTALCFAPHTRHSMSPVDSSTSFITFSFLVMLPMSIVKGDKIMEWGIRSDNLPPSCLKRDYHRQESDCMRGG